MSMRQRVAPGWINPYQQPRLLSRLMASFFVLAQTFFSSYSHSKEVTCQHT